MKIEEYKIKKAQGKLTLKKESELRVGDEVQYINDEGQTTSTCFVITSFDSDGSLNGIGVGGIAFCSKNPKRWKKTGKHYPEAEQFMKAIGEKI